jgi:hypothetical protein
MGVLTLKKRSVLPEFSELFAPGKREEDLRPVSVERSALPSLVEDFPVKRERIVVVDNKEIQVPPEVKRKMTVAALKILAEIYRGLVVFMQTGNGWKKMRDSDVIEMEGDKNFQSRKEVVPVNNTRFKSVPGFRLD